MAMFSCKNNTKKVKQAPVTFKKEGELTLFKSNTDSIIAKLDIEIADNEYERQTGLMYRESLKPNQAMLFVFNNVNQRSFYMKNTRIPLDLIFLNHNKHIVSFQENAQPLSEESLPSKTPAQFVLEVNAGLSQKWQLEVGDRMEYYEIRHE